MSERFLSKPPLYRVVALDDTSTKSLDAIRVMLDQHTIFTTKFVNNLLSNRSGRGSRCRLYCLAVVRVRDRIMLPAAAAAGGNRFRLPFCDPPTEDEDVYGCALGFRIPGVCIHVVFCATVPGARRTGVMSSIVEHLKHAGLPVVLHSAEDEETVRFWERRGFDLRLHRRDHLRPSVEDAIEQSVDFDDCVLLLPRSHARPLLDAHAMEDYGFVESSSDDDDDGDEEEEEEEDEVPVGVSRAGNSCHLPLAPPCTAPACPVFGLPLGASARVVEGAWVDAAAAGSAGHRKEAGGEEAGEETKVLDELAPLGVPAPAFVCPLCHASRKKSGEPFLARSLAAHVRQDACRPASADASTPDPSSGSDGGTQSSSSARSTESDEAICTLCGATRTNKGILFTAVSLKRHMSMCRTRRQSGELAKEPSAQESLEGHTKTWKPTDNSGGCDNATVSCSSCAATHTQCGTPFTQATLRSHVAQCRGERGEKRQAAASEEASDPKRARVEGGADEADAPAWGALSDNVSAPGPSEEAREEAKAKQWEFTVDDLLDQEGQDFE
eukprot:Rhum_TRINITY_DN3035_c0_g1::Rhum_TRINITY_DN3035_c0_g1_i1::g.9174::m.9174